MPSILAHISIFLRYVDFYHEALLKNNHSFEAKDYLKKRNLKLSDVKKFKIGYVDKSSSLFDVLKKEFSEINISKSIKSQFNKIRTRDNENFPAYFYCQNRKYKIKIY